MTFEAIYTTQYAAVQNFCWSKLGNRADADEVTQDAFLSLFKTWGKYEQQNECRGLLVQKAKWLIYDRYKQQKHVPITNDIVYRHKFPDPLTYRLLDMIWKLPALQRRSVIMHYFADMTFDEIAKAMGTGISTAEYRTKAGVRKLREMFNVGGN